MLRTLRTFGIPAISASLLIFGFVHIFSAERVAPSVAPPAFPPRSPQGAWIAGSGIVEPQSENIAVGSAQPGVVMEVFVPQDRVGTLLAAGDPLFRVDDRHWRSELEVQKARLSVPQAELARLESLPRPEEIPPARFRVESAKANLARADDAYQRLKSLDGTDSISKGELVEAEKTRQFAEAESMRAQAELELLLAGAWDSDQAVVRANIAQIAAEIARIETEIDRAMVRAPVDAVVLQINVRPGEYVAAPPTKDLFVLGDMRQPHVRVDIDESDIPRFQAGAIAKATLRGDSKREYSLRFIRVEPFVIPKRSLTGANTERVDTRVLQVIYAVEHPTSGLYVGQQLDVFIQTDATATDDPQSAGNQE